MYRVLLRRKLKKKIQLKQNRFVTYVHMTCRAAIPKFIHILLNKYIILKSNMSQILKPISAPIKINILTVQFAST